MADGGEGSISLLRSLDGFVHRRAKASDALGRDITVEYLLSDSGTVAHIETARACGLPGVADLPAQPLLATSAGVGTLIEDALDAGVDEIVLYLGGSACTDGGVGLLSSLGMRFLDRNGDALPPGGGALASLEIIDMDGLHSRAADTRWTLVTDVDAVLTGPKGAAHVFGPQKGADQADVAALDFGLTRLAKVAKRSGLSGIGSQAGSGAAGGMGALAVPLFNARIVPGALHFMGITGLSRALSNTDVVLTGEGRFDSQSLTGKVAGTVASLARAATSPVAVAVLAGSVDRITPSDNRLSSFSISPGPSKLDDLQEHAGDLLSSLAVSVIQLALDVRSVD
jgi:glycerate kinase